MESWDDLAYGPLRIITTAKRLVRFGDAALHLGRAEFSVCLRLIACQGGAVSRAMLTRGLASEYMLRLTVCRLRKRLARHLDGSVAIKSLRHYGYQLSLSGEFSFALYGYSICRLCPSMPTRSAICLCRASGGSSATRVCASVRAASTNLRFLMASMPRSERPDCLAP